MVLTSSWTAHVWPVVIEDSLQHWVQHIEIPAKALKQVQLIMMYGRLKSTYPWDSCCKYMPLHISHHMEGKLAIENRISGIPPYISTSMLYKVLTAASNTQK